MRRLLPLLALLLACPAIAQESSSYKLTEHTFNAAGHPAEGAILTSTSRRLTLDALGETMVGTGLESDSYHMDGGFVTAYPPPGEVAPCDGPMGVPCPAKLEFPNSPEDKETMAWPPEKSRGSYTLYRGSATGYYDDCGLESDIADESTTDPTTPSSGSGFYYLVTAANRLGEEGTKGSSSDGVERPPSGPCP